MDLLEDLKMSLLNFNFVRIYIIQKILVLLKKKKKKEKFTLNLNFRIQTL